MVLENVTMELINLIWLPCRDASQFFEIATESVVSQMETEEKLKPPVLPGRTRQDRSDSSGHESRRQSSSGSLLIEKTLKIMTKPTPSVAASTPTGAATPKNSTCLPRLSVPFSGATPASRSTKSPHFTKLPKLSVAHPTPVREKITASSLPPLLMSADPARCDTAASFQDDLGDRCRSAEEQNLSTVIDHSILIIQLDKATKEWKKMYSRKILDVLVAWIRSQLDDLRFLVAPGVHKSRTKQQSTALFLIDSTFNQNEIEMSPSLDDIQEVVHAAGKVIVNVAKGVYIDYN